MEPEWEYRITGGKKIDDIRFQHIKENYGQIYSRILQEKRVMIDWFFENYPKSKKR